MRRCWSSTVRGGAFSCARAAVTEHRPHRAHRPQPLAFSAAAFVGTWLAPRLAERVGSRPALILGSLATAAGYLLTALAHGSVSGFVAWQILVGIGNGLVLATLPPPW